MSELTDFQQQHGDKWQQIAESPEFAAAMQFLNLQKITAIAALTPEEIAAKGTLVLADLVGHLNHENNLMTLASRKEFVFQEVAEDYPDAIAEHAAEHPQEFISPSAINKPRKKR